MSDSDTSRTPSGPSSPGLHTPSVKDLHKSLSALSLREFDAEWFKTSVWRPPNEAKRHPRTFEQLWVNSVALGARAFLLAWAVRGGLNLFVTLLRNVKKGRLSVALVQQALFAQSAINFGRVFGAFAFIWRFVFCSLRIYNVGAKGQMQQERWHAPLAGALAGLCILFETPANRAGLAQQFLVRGLQGFANRAHHKGLLRIPHGNVLLFGAANAVIMGCFITDRQALDQGYYKWILAASHSPPQCLDVGHALNAGKALPIPMVERFLQNRKLAPGNRRYLEQMISTSKSGDKLAPFGPCAMHHPAFDSCLRYSVSLWPVVFRWILPIYLGLNFVPPLLLKRKMWLKQPGSMAARSLTGGAMSSAFLATFVIIFQWGYCSSRNVYDDKRWPEALRKAMSSRKIFWLWGFLTCGSLLLEDQRRRTELALYCLPKSMEALWNVGRRRQLIPRVPFGVELLSMGGMALLMDTWVHERERLSSLVRAILWQTLGP